MDPHPHPHLNCPRCDSTNTKFCYYNNYNLSQPRHFCKACKRYWTRGGTLRNVPVGGGCRKKNKSKNKIKVKCNDDVQITTQPIDLPTQAASDNLNIPHLFYTNYSNPNPYMDQLNFPFSTNGLGLGFSSGLMASHEVQNDNELFKQIQNNVVIGNTNDSLLGFDYNQDQEMMRRGRNGKEVVKVEGTDHCRLNWNNQVNLGQINSSDSSDSSSLLWNTNINNVGSWFRDPSNIGSSVSSLI